ncbi:MAG TPA: hypothetical protein VGT61_05705 [Thermomicrobiales bacterium]|jgi:hypothetical protein|nr:hypothetical protein [Thermomicrobiales bacterium]
MSKDSTTQTEDRTFEPGRHLTRINGAEYLEVKWRLVWLREQHPDAIVETTLHAADDRQAIFKATVSIPGGGSATGWGSESPNDFRDFLEKAETKALGRALAALGFGTQFCPDHEFGADQQRVVDSPVRFNNSNRPRQQRPVEVGVNRAAAFPAGDDHNAPTQRQLSFLRARANENGLNESQLDDLARSLHGSAVSALDRRAVSQLIEHVSEMRSNVTNLAS